VVSFAASLWTIRSESNRDICCGRYPVGVWGECLNQVCTPLDSDSPQTGTWDELSLSDKLTLFPFLGISSTDLLWLASRYYLFFRALLTLGLDVSAKDDLNGDLIS